MRRQRQVYTVSITPFNRARSVDEGAFRAHLRRQADAGVGVYVGGGGSGEGYTLATSEIRRLLEIAVEELKGKVPVRAMGVEPRTASEMTAFLDMAADTGVDAAQVYPLDIGHGHRPTEAEQVAYFREVIEAARLPLMLSSHQSVGYVMPVEALIGLFGEYPHLAGLNFSHHDIDTLRRAGDALAARVEVCVGGPEYSLTCLALGGHGFLSSEGNLAPRLCRSIIDAYDAGERGLAIERFGKLLRLSMALYGNGGIRVTKAVLHRLGLPGGYLRKPRLTPSEETVDRVLTTIEQLSLEELDDFWPAASRKPAETAIVSSRS